MDSAAWRRRCCTNRAGTIRSSSASSPTPSETPSAPRTTSRNIFPSGGGKWWRWKYRFGGKEKRLSFGVYPDVGLKAARDKRAAARQQLAAGIDPGHARKAEKIAQAGAESFEAIAREWHAKFSPGWVASHGDRILRRLEKDVFPWVGDRPIAYGPEDTSLTTCAVVDEDVNQLMLFG